VTRFRDETYISSICLESVADTDFDSLHQHHPVPKLGVLAAAASEHRAAATDCWILHHLLSDAETIATALCRAPTVTLASGIVLYSLHVEV
jgi:hypothetical protein